LNGQKHIQKGNLVMIIPQYAKYVNMPQDNLSKIGKIDLIWINFGM